MMEKLVLKTLFLVISHLAFLTFGSCTVNYVNIGAMLSSSAAEDIFKQAVNKVNTDTSASTNLTLNATSFVISSNPIRAALDVCENLVAKKVYVVLVGSTEITEDSPPISVSYTCSFYHIPVIGITSRESIFSDKTVHQSFLRTVPPYFEQAFIWLGILNHFKWNKVVVFINKDQDSRSIYSRFTALAEKNNINIEKVIIFPSGASNVTDELLELEKTQSRVILFSASSSDAALVYNTAITNNLSVTGLGYIWLVTQQAISGPAKLSAPQGIIGIELDHGSDKSAQVNDAVHVAAKALNTLFNSNENLSDPPASCHETSAWSTGENLYKILVNTSLPNGETGNVAFTKNGDREDSVYKIVNKKTTGSPTMSVVGSFSNNVVTMNDSDLLWPGGLNTTPSGVFVSNHIRVVTLMAHPFVYVKPFPASGKCSDLDEAKKKHVLCTGPLANDDSPQSTMLNHCCTGFCMDLLIRLAEKVNFTYSVHLSEDGNFGALKRVNGTDKKKWNGMVGEVLEGQADLIVASLTINNERAQWIEFSKPFKYQGLTILVKKSTQKNELDSFLRPFQYQLWFLVLLSVHVVAVILYLLDRFSPFGRFKLARKEKEERALNLSSAMWFSWGVLLNSGIGEGTPRSFSARVLGMVWAGFAMIIVASYTANLAAFLVLDRPRDVVTGIDDPNLRNPSDLFKYATVANSSVDAYFRRQVELSSMYNFMEKYNTKTDREGIEAVRNEELKAFIWDSPVLYYEASLDCELTTAGELFGRSGYGIGMPKKSPWSDTISLAILNFHESGVMEELETTWIDIGNCTEEGDAPATLGLNHMLGVFIMVGAGIGAGIVIIILEILYHKHRGWKEEQRELAKKTTDRWRANILLMKKDRAHHPQLSTTTQNGGVSRRNPIYSPDAQTNGQLDSGFTYN